MSSWTRTSKAQQRTHQERSQPEARRRLGFLEKKKDYKLRAVDHEKKQNTIKALRQKALDKNPDEFYFHMIGSKVEDGKHWEKKKEEEATDVQKKLMKSQDLSYVRSKRVSEAKKIDRLKASLSTTFLSSPTSDHIVFVDDCDAAKEMIHRLRSTTSDSPAAQLPTGVPNATQPVYVPLSESEKILNKERKKALHELEQRVQRLKELTITEQKLQIRKNLLEKQKPIKVQDGSKESAAVYKWTFKRKR